MTLIDTFILKKKDIHFGTTQVELGKKNNGMRIDHFLVSNSIINLVKDVKINKFPRGREKPSDHTPIEIELT